MNRSAPSRAGGFSLIELMIAVTLGLLLIAVTAAFLQASSATSRLQSAFASANADARFGLETLSDAVKSAGYRGCTASHVTPPDVERVVTGDARNGPWRPVTGYRVDETGGWSPAMPVGYGGTGYEVPADGARGAPVAGDVILVEGGAVQGGRIVAMDRASKRLRLGSRPATLDPGSLAVIVTCGSTDALRVRSMIEMGASTFVMSDRDLPASLVLPAGGSPGIRLIPFRRTLYFVGTTGRFTARGEPVRALFEHSYPYDGVPVEIAEGVEALAVRYLVRDGADRLAELGAGAATLAAQDVEAVRVGIVVAADVHGTQDEGPASYRVADTTVAIEGAVPADHAGAVIPDDGRVRRTFETMVTTRSRVVSLDP